MDPAHVIAFAAVVVVVHVVFCVVLDIRWRRKVNARLRAMSAEPTDDC